MHLGPESFQAITDPWLAKALFKANVRRVEVETHSYCNRRCGYCPNVVGDRLGPNERMDPRLFGSIVGELAELDFSGVLVLSNYNEPLADRAIVERIAEARAALPQVRIQIYTNGDYLDPAYVDDLAQAGLSGMHISIHMRADDVYSDAYAIDRITELCARLGRPFKTAGVRGGQHMAGRVPHPKIDIEMRALNYWVTGQDRGGLIAGMPQRPARTAPCHFPFSHFYIGYKGAVVPCCHLRSDSPAHAPYRTAQLSPGESIALAYAGAAAAAWRRTMVGSQPKAAPCATCTAGDPGATGDFAARLHEAYLRFGDGRGPGVPAGAVTASPA